VMTLSWHECVRIRLRFCFARAALLPHAIASAGLTWACLGLAVHVHYCPPGAHARAHSRRTVDGVRAI
jgi:hypothetical protein